MALAAFLSYATADKAAAARLKTELEQGLIATFMAHEDISVSETWRVRLLRELRSSDLFVCLLSVNYLGSHWCMQEAGIAAYRLPKVVILLVGQPWLVPLAQEAGEAAVLLPHRRVPRP